LLAGLKRRKNFRFFIHKKATPLGVRNKGMVVS